MAIRPGTPDRPIELIELHGAARKDGKPFVLVLIDGQKRGQLTPAEAIAHGTRSIQAAIEAERDAGMVKAMKKAGATDDQIAEMLIGLREERSQADPDPTRSVRPEDAERD